jgi:stress response protein YsnF
VRLDTDTVTDERQVAEEVRKERIDVDDEGRRRWAIRKPQEGRGGRRLLSSPC